MIIIGIKVYDTKPSYMADKSITLIETCLNILIIKFEKRGQVGSGSRAAWVQFPSTAAGGLALLFSPS